MAKKTGSDEVNLDESSVYEKGNDEQRNAAYDDVATEATLDRLEAITGGAEDEPAVYEGRLAQEFDALDASTDEELDALRVKFLQDDPVSSVRDGSGRITDDLAEEQIAKFTETGPMQSGLGVESVTPGRDDTSSAIRMHHPDTHRGRSESIVEGNLDEPRDEEFGERLVDEGTGS
jgi:hypothetical protein